MKGAIQAINAQCKRNRAARLAEIQQGIAAFFDNRASVKSAIVQGYRTSACIAFYAHQSAMGSRYCKTPNEALAFVSDRMIDKGDSLARLAA